MKRITAIGYMVMLGIASINLIACSPMREVHAGEQSVAESQPVAPEVIPTPSCADPTPEIMADCQAQAEIILASTVRLEIHGQGGGIGHATVVGGRYLITHNHYPVSGDALGRGGDGLVSAVSVFKNNGDIVLVKAPLAYFTVAAVEPEAMVLDFQTYGGVGFFDSLGVPSIESRSWGNEFGPGAVVAQVDWDGSKANVIWSQVTAVNTNSVTYIELDSFVEQGASGGGVFQNGVHVGNNWSRLTDKDADSGEVLRQYSVAAVNTGSIVAATLGATEVAVVGN